jgi:Spy/CpxP family protein refolding chaperone
MRSNRNTHPMLTRVLAGTVLAGSLAFAAQADAQQAGQAGKARTERAEGRGGRGGDPAQMVDRRVERLTQELQLSSGQTAAIRQILLDQHAQMETLRPEGGPRRAPGDSAARGERRQRPDSATMAQNRAKFEALRTQTDAKIEGVLSADQRTAYRELAAKRGERPEGARGGRGPGGDGRGRGGQRPPPPPAK